MRRLRTDSYQNDDREPHDRQAAFPAGSGGSRHQGGRSDDRCAFGGLSDILCPPVQNAVRRIAYGRRRRNQPGFVSESGLGAQAFSARAMSSGWSFLGSFTSLLTG